MMREDAIRLARYAVQEMAHIHLIISIHDYSRSRSLLQLLQASYQQVETHPEGKSGDGSNWIRCLDNHRLESFLWVNTPLEDSEETI